MARKMKAQYYLAYGSNLNLEQMKRRCPAARVVGATLLKGYRLLFRGTHGNTHATVEISPKNSVPSLLWKITPADEIALDRYEGAPRYYRKENLLVRVGEEVHTALIYVMSPGNKKGEPSPAYFDTIKEGYETAGFDIGTLETALAASCRKKGTSP